MDAIPEKFKEKLVILDMDKNKTELMREKRYACQRIRRSGNDLKKK